jgi:serine/threonine protein phosphatase PrpC
MMIASDGIQQLTDAQVINVIGQLWRDGHNAEEISKRIVECLAKNTQSDNITCIIVFFKPRPDPLQ